MTTLALIGNPNCGKTTLFNALTGTQQRVGNWPGVTVERKSGHFSHQSQQYELVDLPGIYSLDAESGGLDEQIARQFLDGDEADILINMVDATSLSRGLYLTSQLAALNKPMVVVLSMMDVAQAQHLSIDVDELSRRLGCPVIPMVASRAEGLNTLRQQIPQASVSLFAAGTQGDAGDADRYQAIDRLTEGVIQTAPQAQTSRSYSQRIDDWVLHRIWAFPIFLAVMYLMFFLSINVGSAFIDFFDLIGSVLFVEAPRAALEWLSLPPWLIALLADGVGGGVQLVGTFIPVIGALFLVLSMLEDSGYMARVAFIVDRLLRRLGLPGKSFVPLIVGFGCNVPSVMATRALDSEPDRILTTIMSPYMSCGARLTVYALFAAAFFPNNGQNVVFALYLIGIIIAVLSALAVRKHLLPEARSTFVLELPAYHVPTARNILLQTWQRLKGFVTRAGKAIVMVVILLNAANSIGTDGSIGNQNTEQSVLSAIGKQITPLFAPMGIAEDNWPATVGIFTGIFAKEVVVGTLDALYAPQTGDEDVDLLATIGAAFQSIPDNLSEAATQIADPLGLDLGDLSDTQAQAESVEVQLNTISAMQNLFDGQLGAFAYLLFVLLYMPCVATIGAIYKEIGGFWATFSAAWSFIVAYGCAVLAYQLGQVSDSPTSALIHIAVVVFGAGGLFWALIHWGKRRAPTNLIPLKIID